MNSLEVQIKIQDTQFSVFPGHICGKDLYDKASIDAGDYLLMLDLPGEIDIPVAPGDVLVITGSERFVVSKPCSSIPNNPSLHSPYDFKLNGQSYTGELAYTKAKITTEELASLINKTTNDTRFVLDLDGMADVILPNEKMIIMGNNWRLITTPIGGDIFDLEDCNGGDKPNHAHKYRIRVNNDKHVVDAPHMLGRDILVLAGIQNPEQVALYQKFKDGVTTIIALDDKVDFTAPGVERFITIPLDMTEGFEPRCQFQLPEDDSEFLNSLDTPWEAVIENNVRRIILHDFPLEGGYTTESVTVNIRIESGYPESQIDMAYFHPQIQRADGVAIKAIAPDSFDGKSWQRWSRHRTGANPWRPGIDNISTHVAAIRSWLVQELQK